MKAKNIIAQVLCSLVLFALIGACKDDAKDIGSVFEISAENLSKDIDKSAATFMIPVNTNLDQSAWNVESTERWMRPRKSITANAPSITVSVDENTGNNTRSAQIKVTSNIQNYTITVTQYGANDVVVGEDIQVKPYGGKASEFQPGYEIEKTFDGKFTEGSNNSHYHSTWNNNTSFPVTLEYYFRGDTEIDYLIYYTRSGNGNFGEVDIYTSTEPGRSNYTLQGSYDFKMKNDPSRVTFSEGIKATGIKFVVKSGAANYVSCDEMHFFKKNTDNTLETKLLTVFKDVTCTELKPNVTTEEINSLPSNYFIRIAEALRNNTYDAWEKEFRIRDYQAYSDIDEWAEKLMTKRYSNLDNLTGIAAQKDDEVIVLVGDTHGQEVALQCVGEEQTGFGEERTYVQTAASGDVYYLKTGVNKVKIRNKGQLFVMYNCDLTTNPQPIKIHIPLGSGTVSGFFDLKEHKTDAKYAELLSKATDKYFGVRGDKIIFYFHRSKLREFVKDEILSAIDLWDNIVGWEQELMGIGNVRPNLVNNHIFAISPEGSYMWASDYRIAFIYTYLNNILLYDNVMRAKDNAWGPAHEIGHIHQLAIDWPGSTESSNNLFSNYVLYKLGKYCSRGTELNLPKASDNRVTDSDGYITKMTLSEAHCVLNRAWYDFGGGHQGENTELHMRMNWQLWNYYHRCGHQPDFWQKVFNLMRDNRTASNNPGVKQLLFARMASEAAQEDLTEFFEMWGFFVPVNAKIEQYGTYDYLVTEPMINETKAAMAKYPKAKPFYYLEDRKQGDIGLDTTPPDVGYYTQFQNIKPITKDIRGRINGRQATITNGDEAVAFELRERNASGKLLYFSTFFSFEIPSSVSLANAKLYAVQADGNRIELAE